MSYTPNNVSVYLAAFQGALAGFYDAQFSNAEPDYAMLADTWAQAVDLEWGSAGYTTLELASITSCSLARWQGQAPAEDGQRYTPSAYLASAALVVGLVQAGNAQVVAEGINPNAGGGGGGGGGSGTAPTVIGGQTYNVQLSDAVVLLDSSNGLAAPVAVLPAPSFIGETHSFMWYAWDARQLPPSIRASATLNARKMTPYGGLNASGAAGLVGATSITATGGFMTIKWTNAGWIQTG